MGWEDRSYYREGRSGPPGPLNWLMTGSINLFRLFGIQVRMHASLLVLMVLIVLLGFGGFGDSIASRVQSITALFAIVLLHEFGHCFAARWTGGHANEILMTPLGGLAFTMARRRPWPTFVTVAGGPAVNVIICLICGAALYQLINVWPLGPWQFTGGKIDNGVFENNSLIHAVGYIYWIYLISYGLLLFNLLPIYPLDGGQLLQSILWKPLGYYKSLLVTVTVGLIGSVLLILAGFGLIPFFGGGLLMAFIGLNCLINCYRTRVMLKAEGPWAFSDEDSSFDGGGTYGGSLGHATETRRPKAPSWFARKRAERIVQEEMDEQQEIDTILAKVSASGMNSLTAGEKRALKKATENQRKREQEKLAARKQSLGH